MVCQALQTVARELRPTRLHSIMLVGLQGFSASLCVAQSEKSMSIQIRLATPEDAGAIARIAADAGVASIDAEAPRVRRVLAQNQTHVATINAVVIGFIGCFFTPNSSGGWRFELDLLAVARGAQGRGAGGELMAASMIMAAKKGARTIRALVRCENGAMQRLCRRHGFTRCPDVFELHVVDPLAVIPPSRQHAARLIPVETLSYAGLWLEGELSQEAIDDAHRLASQGDASVIGAVIPHYALETGELLQSNGFRRIGAYHWWTFNL